jgi:hypothetical protein
MVILRIFPPSISRLISDVISGFRQIGITSFHPSAQLRVAVQCPPL